MKTKVRSYEASDFESVHQLMHELGYPMDEDELRFNLDLIQQRKGIILVAEADGNAVGCISVLVNAGLAEGLFGEIVSLVVSKDYRGLGIGRKLVQQAENWLKPNVRKIRIRANRLRLEAHEFYKSLGYKEIKTQISFMKNV